MQLPSTDALTRERALLLLSGAVAASLLPALWRRLQRRSGRGGLLAAAVDASRSTTSSAGGGTAAYETRRAVDEYLQFHYGRPEEILPYDVGPKVRGCGLNAGGENGWVGGGCVVLVCFC